MTHIKKTIFVILFLVICASLYLLQKALPLFCRPDKAISQRVEQAKPVEQKAAKADPLWQIPRNRSIDTMAKVPGIILPLFVTETNRPTYKEQLATIKDLPDNLNREEREGIYLFLRIADNDKYTLNIKSELMGLLRTQKTFPPEYVDALITIVRDHLIDGDIRGYALQHLRCIYDQENIDQRQLRDLYYKSLNDNATDVAGTAALTLVNLAIEFPLDFDQSTIDSGVLTLAQDETTSIPSRITAVQLCGKLQLTDALPMVRELIDSADDMTLKVAALYTLGQIGTADDLAVLDQIYSNGSPLFAKVTKNAIDSISERL